MKGITLSKKKDGYWLFVRTSSGKQACVCLDNISHSYLVRSAFLEWAEELTKTEKTVGDIGGVKK